MKYRTYKKWNKKGYHVMSGQVHVKRSTKGKPLFSYKQVVKCNTYDNYYKYDGGFDNEDYDDITPYDLGYDW